ncbi:endo-1,4-beta-xylanase [Acaryochloris marina NIES-2412]|uniref:endo-1,4-beta-xylanase n=1 Tax=Acaryochloris marina TaxID=155978 RepID=UPI00405869B7
MIPYFNRRRCLRLGLGAFVSLGTVLGSRSIFQNHKLSALDNPSRDFSIKEWLPLRELAANKDIIFGASARYDQVISDEQFAALFAQECSLLVPEWELKWSAGHHQLRPSPDEFDFSAADAMLSFAQAHNLLFRGHALIWHESLPRWFQEVVNHQNAANVMKHHIETVVGHYRGRMHSWDVVNESIDYDPLASKRADGLKETPWLEFLGPDYIDMAFRIAAKADPDALLVYNDFGVDYNTAMDRAKRRAILGLLKRLKAKGTPIHALGIQAHLRGESLDFDPKSLRQFLQEVAALDLKILITEMDVNDSKLPADIQRRDRIVAGVYEDYLSVVLDEPAVIAVITWGLSDRYTYLSKFFPRSDNQPVRPLPLDTNLQPKLAWNALARSFQQTHKR